MKSAVHPIKKAQRRPCTEIVKEYLRQHPGETTRQIIAATKITKNVVQLSLQRMERAGVIHRVRSHEDRYYHWVLGPAKDWNPDEKEPRFDLKQVWSQSWPKIDIAPQTIFSPLGL
jgi:hypothetical protein